MSDLRCRVSISLFTRLTSLICNVYFYANGVILQRSTAASSGRTFQMLQLWQKNMNNPDSNDAKMLNTTKSYMAYVQVLFCENIII